MLRASPIRHLTRSAESGFSMVEIALCLGILGFALVAIIGVLPTGLKVQKENREETIINQDALYILEALRSGSKGVDDLTNYVESITIRSGPPTSSRVYSTNAGPYRLVSGQQIIGLLSTPKLHPNTLRTNSVTAVVRAITGIAAEKGPDSRDFALRYQVTAEVVAFTNVPPVMLLNAYTNQFLQTTNLFHNLFDLRLTIRWPLFLHGDAWVTGRNRKTYRTLVTGELIGTNMSGQEFFWFQPNTFTAQY